MKKLWELNLKRITLLCLAVTMVVIIAVFEAFFILEKVEIKASSNVTGNQLTYSVNVDTVGKYTLKRATVAVKLYNNENRVLTSYEVIVTCDEIVQNTVTVPEGYALTGFTMVKYSLNNNYEIIVMCLCGVVLIYAVTFFGLSFKKRYYTAESEE